MRQREHSLRPQTQSSAIRVMVVGESSPARGLEVEILDSDPLVEIVSSVVNSRGALEILERTPTDIVILDLDLQREDSLNILSQVIKIKPDVQVLLVSVWTQFNADVFIRAISLGAKDYLLKPGSLGELVSSNDFRKQLLKKVKELWRSSRSVPASLSAGVLRTRASGQQPPQVLMIGSSTGGPQALFNVLGGLSSAGGVKQPVLITQHMPPPFTSILAEQITRSVGFPAKEAEHGEEIKGGQAYVAPGDHHMLLEVKNGKKVFRLTRDPPENFCRPAVDPMFRAGAAIYGSAVLACVLTGMGVDGSSGAQTIVDAGGTVIAQDQKTSVVWGMPGATARSGVCSAILPINEIAGYVHSHATRLF